MGKEIVAGVSYSGNRSHIAVYEVKNGDVKLLHLAEHLSAKQSDHWFLEKIISPELRILKKADKVSVALDINSVVLHTFPLDTTLNQSEQNGHVHWELSNFIKNYQPKEYIYDLHSLRISARDQVADVLVVAIKREKLFGIQSALESKKIELHIADTSFFGAEQTLLSVFPEIRNKTVALILSDFNEISIGIFVNGRVVKFGHNLQSTSDSIVNLFQSIKQEEIVTELYLCGGTASQELGVTLRNRLGIHVNMLNPFRRNITTSSYSDFKLFAGKEHLFAAATGVALRKR
ncbi:MAG: pilus assembly protein PilM [Ignavibacteriales bacterium]|nr:pilus assembly protein PilM [Ignavibacteriales bacterium]